MMGGQLKENVWKENVAQTLPEGPVDKRLYQARATVSRLLGYGKWGPVECKNKSVCKLSRKKMNFSRTFHYIVDLLDT